MSLIAFNDLGDWDSFHKKLDVSTVTIQIWTDTLGSPVQSMGKDRHFQLMVCPNLMLDNI